MYKKFKHFYTVVLLQLIILYDFIANIILKSSCVEIHWLMHWLHCIWLSIHCLSENVLKSPNQFFILIMQPISCILSLSPTNAYSSKLRSRLWLQFRNSYWYCSKCSRCGRNCWKLEISKTFILRFTITTAERILEPCYLKFRT
jgi:hypothetical protein